MKYIGYLFAFLTATVMAASFSTPASALTLEEAWAEIAGMHCSGSICTSSEDGSVTVDLPDVTASYTGTTYHWVDVPLPANGTYKDKYDWAKDGKWRAMKPKGKYTKTYVVDGGTETLPTCTVTTKELIYNGPYTSRALAWSVNTSVQTSPGPCLSN